MTMKYASGAGQMVSGAFDSDGHFFPLDSLQQTITKDGSGNSTIVATDGKYTWTQTITVSGSVTTISMWAKA